MRTRFLAVGLLGAVAAAGLWWRRHPSACPYGQGFWIEAPHPLITRERLREALEPRAGETVLEIGSCRRRRGEPFSRLPSPATRQPARPLPAGPHRSPRT